MYNITKLATLGGDFTYQTGKYTLLNMEVEDHVYLACRVDGRKYTKLELAGCYLLSKIMELFLQWTASLVWETKYRCGCDVIAVRYEPDVCNKDSPGKKLPADKAAKKAFKPVKPLKYKKKPRSFFGFAERRQIKEKLKEWGAHDLNELIGKVKESLGKYDLAAAKKLEALADLVDGPAYKQLRDLIRVIKNQHREIDKWAPERTWLNPQVWSPKTSFASPKPIALPKSEFDLLPQSALKNYTTWAISRIKNDVLSARGGGVVIRLPTQEYKRGSDYCPPGTTLTDQDVVAHCIAIGKSLLEHNPGLVAKHKEALKELYDLSAYASEEEGAAASLVMQMLINCSQHASNTFITEYLNNGSITCSKSNISYLVDFVEQKAKLKAEITGFGKPGSKEVNPINAILEMESDIQEGLTMTKAKVMVANPGSFKTKEAVQEHFKKLYNL